MTKDKAVGDWFTIDAYATRAVAPADALVAVGRAEDLLQSIVADYGDIDGKAAAPAWEHDLALIEAHGAAVARMAELRLLERIEKEAKRRYCQDGRSSVFHTFDVVCEIRKELTNG